VAGLGRIYFWVGRWSLALMSLLLGEALAVRLFFAYTDCTRAAEKNWFLPEFPKL